MPTQRKKTERGGVFSKTLFENVSYQDKEAPGREFNECKFHKCNLYGANFEGAIFHDCVFDGCDLSLLRLKHASLVNVHITNSKAMGIQWYYATNLFSLKFTSSCLDFSSFFGKALKKAPFVDCLARDVDFTQCNLTEANFEGADLLNAIFRESDISKANFVNARNYFIPLQLNTVKGARFSLPEAISLFDGFGIVIE